MIVPALFSVAPLIVATVADERRTAVFAGAAVALAIGSGWWHGVAGDAVYWARIAAVCIISTMAVAVAAVRRRREKRLARMTAIAEASQLALLPPLPPEITGVNIAARYRSAAREASVGGDLYEIIATGHGIRVIIGDVRGKGLDAILLAGQVLSAFRRSAVAMPSMDQVAGDVGRAIRPHVGEEDFVTAALVANRPIAAQPHRCQSAAITRRCCPLRQPAAADQREDRPAAGLEDDFTAFTATWSPGYRLLLYTDGLVESRDQHGEFLQNLRSQRRFWQPIAIRHWTR